jgi:hypothetical protein
MRNEHIDQKKSLEKVKAFVEDRQYTEDEPEPVHAVHIDRTNLWEAGTAEIDRGNYLFSHGFERGSGGVIVAPSGIGKSVLAMQAAMHWALGETAFEIKVPGSIKSLTIQAEDSKNDIRMICRMIRRFDLSLDHQNTLATKAIIKTIKGAFGRDFLRFLKTSIRREEPDLVIINPLSAFIVDLNRTELFQPFLYGDLAGIIAEFNIGLILIHHTPKYGRTVRGETGNDPMYAGAGPALLTNWARFYLTIEPVRGIEGLYRFTAGKGKDKLGWQEKSQYFQHNFDGHSFYWEKAELPPNSTIEKKEMQTKLTVDDLVTKLHFTQPMRKTLFESVCLEAGFTKRKFEVLYADAIENERIFEFRLKESGYKTGQPPVMVSRNKPTEYC